MNTRLERRRKHLQKKWKIRLTIGGIIAASVLVVLPLVIRLLNLLWTVGLQ